MFDVPTLEKYVMYIFHNCRCTKYCKVMGHSCEQATLIKKYVNLDNKYPVLFILGMYI